MVRFLGLHDEQEQYKLRLLQFKGKHENNTGRESYDMDDEESSDMTNDMYNTILNEPSEKRNDGSENRTLKRELTVSTKRSEPSEKRKNGDVTNPRSPLPYHEGDLDRERLLEDMKTMKEKFAKLLLGEDMSGGGKGVSSALALSNAITNLAASVFGEIKKLEPMGGQRKTQWKKEIDWLLGVTDHIVHMVPSRQRSTDGSNMEIMTTRQRTDLLMNIPALRKLDAMLIECLENFADQNEFVYVSKDDDSEKGKAKRPDDKWWIPTPKVPINGLSEVTRKWLQFQKDSVSQVLKAAMAINAQVISEMAIPENYIESLPKNGKESLGDLIYKNITNGDYFDPDNFLTMMDLSTDHKILDLKNRIEASVVIWKRKITAKDSKSSWGSALRMEKREIFEDRAETILLIIKHRFPGIPQSSLEISKIQYNKDVGQAILESYSRILESLAFTVISRIDDVLHADNLAQNPSLGQKKRHIFTEVTSITMRNDDFLLGAGDGPVTMTLSDFMGWNGVDQGDNETKKEITDSLFGDDDKLMKKPGNVNTKKFSYTDRLGGLRSPTARH